MKMEVALDTEQLDAMLQKVATDYALNLKQPQGLTAAVLVLNTLIQMENMRLLLQIDRGLNG